MMATQSTGIAKEQDQIIEEFSQFTDWSDKYEYLIDLGKELAPLDPSIKQTSTLSKDASQKYGCMLKLWMENYF
jgi:cysteine desulfuration protein SufE